jgi:hypothetical protein
MKRQSELILAFAVVLILLILLLIYGAYNGKNKPNCAKFPYDKCPSECVVCPPCEVCSSIVCQTEGFCEGIGFNRSWYERVRPK